MFNRKFQKVKGHCDFSYPSFNKLTERHFEKSPWPDAEYVAQLVDGGKIINVT